MTSGRRKSERSTWRKLCSPRLPPVWQRESLCRFWRCVAAGLSSEDAAVEAGVSGPVGIRWFRSSGGMPPTHLSPMAATLTNHNLTFSDRGEIALGALGALDFKQLRASWGGRPARSPVRSGATRRRAAVTLIVGPSPRDSIGLPPISNGQSGVIMEGSSLSLRTCLCSARPILASR